MREYRQLLVLRIVTYSFQFIQLINFFKLTSISLTSFSQPLKCPSRRRRYFLIPGLGRSGAVGQTPTALPLSAAPHLGPEWRQQPEATALRPQILDAERGAVSTPRHRGGEAQLGRDDTHPSHVPPPVRHGGYRLPEASVAAAWKWSLSNRRGALIGSKRRGASEATN